MEGGRNVGESSTEEVKGRGRVHLVGWERHCSRGNGMCKSMDMNDMLEWSRGIGHPEKDKVFK